MSEKRYFLHNHEAPEALVLRVHGAEIACFSVPVDQSREDVTVLKTSVRRVAEAFVPVLASPRAQWSWGLSLVARYEGRVCAI